MSLLYAAAIGFPEGIDIIPVAQLNLADSFGILPGLERRQNAVLPDPFGEANGRRGRVLHRRKVIRAGDGVIIGKQHRRSHIAGFFLVRTRGTRW